MQDNSIKWQKRKKRGCSEMKKNIAFKAFHVAFTFTFLINIVIKLAQLKKSRL